MSALALVRCAGAPRDLGLDQGANARAAIRAALGERRERAARALLPAWDTSAAARRVWRDLARFFPHHAERMQGIALGARVPEAALAAALEALLAGDAGLAAASAAEGARGALLARSLHAPVGSIALRASAPDNDYRSLELAPAWSAAAWIGVNEHGLAAAATALPAAETALAGCAAPAQLLVQDVLQRFDEVDKAVDWALRRPAGGHASLLLADASGRIAGVEIEGRARRSLGAGAHALVGLGPAAAAAALEKALAEARDVDAGALAHAIAEAAAAPLVALADPAGRRLGLARAGAPLAWHALEPPERRRDG